MSQVIAIDGYVATGKGTVAKLLSRRLGYTYLDTGAMYRAVTLYAYRNKLLDADDQTKTDMMSQISLSFVYNPETDHDDMVMNGEVVEHDIRQISLSSQMKNIVGISAIRHCLQIMQQQYASQTPGLVADGRDMGTVVFPHARLKIFLVADVDVRVQRRYQQLLQLGLEADKDNIYQDIVQRDAKDYLSDSAVNKRSPDAVLIDTSTMQIEEVVDHVLSLWLV